MPRLDSLGGRYELSFAVLLAVLAFLGRANPALQYPQILYLFALLLALNLAAGASLRLKPGLAWLSAAFILANCGTITAILEYSGGPGSVLWVLFLLPIFTVCLLLGSKEAALVAAGVVLVNGAYTLLGREEPASVVAFELALKSGFFAITALVAWRLVSRERDSRRRLEAETGRADRLATHLETVSALSEVGLVGSGVAHDLKNAFMVISGFAEAIVAYNTVPPDAKDAFERIQRMAQLGGQMARQLSKHAASVPVQLAPDDLTSVATDVATLLKGSFAEKDVELLVDAAGEPCPVLASRVHLQRVFLNLLLNALSVSRAGGRVRLTVSRSDGLAVASVEDDGPGFSKDALPRLFEPFETTRANEGGTGLGLNLCARIAREHKGELAAANRPEGGAALTLRLPLAT